LLFLPLLMAAGFLFVRRRVALWPAACGAALILAGLLLWQSARPEASGLIALQRANVGGLRPARSWELLPRLAALLRLWRLSLGWPLTVAGLALGILTVGGRRARERLLPADAMLALFVLAYMLLHWLWATPVWDRYMLPILPLAAILIGRIVSILWSAVSTEQSRSWLWPSLYLTMALLVVLHVPVAASARAGRWPIGGQPAADGGAAVAAAALMDAPYGTVLYDHWYSWQWRYQLFDSRVYVSWFAHPDALLADLAVFGYGGPTRYLALPASPVAQPIMRRLAEEGYRLEATGDQPGMTDMTIYRIYPPEMAE
jgi:hypothetical protein